MVERIAADATRRDQTRRRREDPHGGGPRQSRPLPPQPPEHSDLDYGRRDERRGNRPYLLKNHPRILGGSIIADARDEKERKRRHEIGSYQRGRLLVGQMPPGEPDR